MPKLILNATLNCALNKSRANWAEAAVRAYAREIDALDEELAVVMMDLICNLQHLCRREEISFDEVLHGGRMHFEEETRGL